jgi:hypothetical protein
LLDPQPLLQQVHAVQRSIDAQGTAEQPRAPCLVVDAFDGFERAQQHRLRHPFFARDHVEAVPETIDEIHVGVPRRTEQDGVARGLAASGVRGEILGAEIGLGLDDPADAAHAGDSMHEVHADELPRDDERAAGIELPRQLGRRIDQGHLAGQPHSRSSRRRARAWPRA